MLGFQSASNVLGPEFVAAIEGNKLYIEIADKSRQLELIGLVRFEKLTVHPFFAPSSYSAGFEDLTLKKQFNQNLGKYVSSGRYEALKAKYNFKMILPIIKRFFID